MISGNFPKSHRLLKSSQFQALSKKSNTFYGSVLFIVWKKNDCAHARLGITVTKKFGDSHKRNRFKRFVREGFRLSGRLKSLGVDLHVRPKGKEGLLPQYSDIVGDFAALTAQLGA